MRHFVAWVLLFTSSSLFADRSFLTNANADCARLAYEVYVSSDPVAAEILADALYDLGQVGRSDFVRLQARKFALMRDPVANQTAIEEIERQENQLAARHWESWVPRPRFVDTPVFRLGLLREVTLRTNADAEMVDILFRENTPMEYVRFLDRKRFQSNIRATASGYYFGGRDALMDGLRGVARPIQLQGLSEHTFGFGEPDSRVEARIVSLPGAYDASVMYRDNAGVNKVAWGLYDSNGRFLRSYVTSAHGNVRIPKAEVPRGAVLRLIGH